MIPFLALVVLLLVSTDKQDRKLWSFRHPEANVFRSHAQHTGTALSPGLCHVKWNRIAGGKLPISTHFSNYQHQASRSTLGPVVEWGGVL